jgi:hypothetical protein
MWQCVFSPSATNPIVICLLCTGIIGHGWLSSKRPHSGDHTSTGGNVDLGSVVVSHVCQPDVSGTNVHSQPPSDRWTRLRVQPHDNQTASSKGSRHLPMVTNVSMKLFATEIRVRTNYDYDDTRALKTIRQAYRDARGIVGWWSTKFRYRQLIGLQRVEVCFLTTLF